MGERSLSAHYGLACLFQNASGHSFTLAEDQRCTDTYTRKGAIPHWPEAEIREDY